MKKHQSNTTAGKKLSLPIFLSFAALCNPLLAGDGEPGTELTARGMETNMDLPATFHKYYGNNVTYYRDEERKVAKLDMDGDLNYDGAISNEEPGDQGAFEATPPGLVVGVGELSKLVLRLRPYRIDYQGDVVVSIEVAGINRADKAGQFASFEEEIASVGRIRVWSDASKTELFLDSGIEDMRLREFVMDASKYPANLPSVVPRLFYVEGVSPSGNYAGDIRLLATASHRRKGETPEEYTKQKERGFKTFRTTFDHLLLTVHPEPMKKVFINNNAEGAWVSPEEVFVKP